MSKLYPYIFLTLLSLIVCLPGMSRMPVIDRDEAHFAQATRQMLQTGSFFQIRFQDTTRFQKPPGINWLQALSVSIFSDANRSVIWPYRLPSVIGALLSVLLTYFFALRFIPQKTAFWSAVLLACSLLLTIEAHMATIDASLLSSVVIMQGALWVIYTQRQQAARTHWGWALLFWLAMAYGFLLKGVTPLVGGLTVVTLCVVEKKISWLRGLRVYSGLILFIGLSLSWLILVNSAEHSNYFVKMLQKDLLPKLKGGHESHGMPPLSHLFMLPVTFWPGSFFLYQGAKYAYTHRKQPTVIFLLSWILPTWLFFEFMPTKLPQYVLPTFPAIAILLAMGMFTKHDLRKYLLQFLQLLWGVLTVFMGLALIILPYLVLNKLFITGLALGIVIIVLAVICVYAGWQGRMQQAGFAMALSACIAYPGIFSLLLPELEPLFISKQIAMKVDSIDTKLRDSISPSQPLIVVGYAEPSLVFYLNTHNVYFSDAEEALVRARKGTNVIMLLDQATFDVYKQQVTLEVLFTIKGFNYSKGREVTLFLTRVQCLNYWQVR